MRITLRAWFLQAGRYTTTGYRERSVRPGETTASEGECGYESVLVFLKLWKFWKKALKKIPVLK